ncbi:MAG: 2-hydroxyglutaryl-CoA dehydratase, D-component [Dehalococcoidales bacterium]|nr:2-hydroxyglutaryl-CoA dehydratase, D-component [Dehalococcoidales bacterium]
MENEDRLGQLLARSDARNWLATASEWKKQGGKVVGLLCSNVPEEVLTAAGIFPVRLMKLAHPNTPLSDAYRPVHTDVYYNNVLESVLRGELGVLDGIVTTNRDDDMRRLIDAIESVHKFPLVYIMHCPHITSETGVKRFTQEIGHLLERLEALWGVKVSTEALRNAVKEQNQTRRLVQSMYLLKKGKELPLTGAECLKLCLAAMAMPKASFNEEAEALLPHIKQRKPRYTRTTPRLMVTGDVLDEPAFVALVEDAAGPVVIDDLDLGYRYFWGQVDTADKDIIASVARYYLTRPGAPRFPAWEEQVKHMISLAREYKAEGVVELGLRNSLPTEYRSPSAARDLREAGIPFLSLRVEYAPTSIEQMRTRVEAFGESLRGRAG